MKVALYVVSKPSDPKGRERGAGYFHWDISLDINVDIEYWSKHSPHITIYQLNQSISLGQALWLQQRLMTDLSDLTSRICEESELMSEWEQSIQFQMKELQQTDDLPRTLVLSKINRNPNNSNKHYVPPQLDPAIVKRLEEQLQGRALLQEELMDLLSFMELKDIHWRSYLQYLHLQGAIELLTGVSCEMKQHLPSLRKLAPKKVYQCARCGGREDTMHWTNCTSCECDCPYCEACLNMGRTRFCSLLIHGSSGHPYTPSKHIHVDPSTFATPTTPANPPQLRESRNTYIMTPSQLQKWHLSPAQQEAASLGLSFLHTTFKQNKPQTSPACFLIWAVTGAGKTEITFPLIESELARKGKIALTTPRRDVVLELKPRLQKAFPDRTVVTLYGGSEHRWEQGDLILATTHQMLRFSHAFDLIVIDEVDAFPFKFNQMLEYAVHKSCKPKGRYILLSATPLPHLQKAMRKKQLPHAKVSVRFHRYPLPVPRQITIKIKAGSATSFSIPRGLQRELEHSLNKGSQVFLFVPRIKLITPLHKRLSHLFPHAVIEGTSSQDKERVAKVQAFRDGIIRILITTTILERGVTVPKTDVLVLYADDDIFDESALVQMAGRSGRALADPFGKVRFLSEHKTRMQVRAIKQIKAMNRIASQKGYLNRQEGDAVPCSK